MILEDFILQEMVSTQADINGSDAGLGDLF